MGRSTQQALIGFSAIVALLAGIAILATRGNDERGLRADVLSTRRAEPGELVDITISARDTFGAVKRIEVDFGDGNAAEPRVKDPGADCRSDFARTEKFDYQHTYTDRGPFTVRATVVTGGCGAKDETVEAIRTIDVKPLRRS